jgi:hypothetical protein
VAVQVFDDLDRIDKPMILTVAHAVGSLSRAGLAGKTDVYSHPYEWGAAAEVHGKAIGRVVRSAPALPPASRALEVDAALIELNDDVRFNNDTCMGPLDLDLGVFDIETEIDDAMRYLTVHKVGAASGFTTGEMPCKKEQGASRLPAFDNERFLYFPVYEIVSEAGDFSVNGDSGALVFDDSMRPLGMLVAKIFSGPPPALSLCTPLARILAALKVHL